METRIKRIAQFMWDNADSIVEFLTQSEHYRSAQFEFDLHVPKEPSDLKISFCIYDENHTHLYLFKDEINTEEFAKICETMNKKTGVIPPPVPVEVREKLE